jgi:hypothetical protein
MAKDFKYLTPDELQKWLDLKGWNQSQGAAYLEITEGWFSKLMTGAKQATAVTTRLIRCEIKEMKGKK